MLAPVILVMPLDSHKTFQVTAPVLGAAVRPFCPSLPLVTGTSYFISACVLLLLSKLPH